MRNGANHALHLEIITSLTDQMLGLHCNIHFTMMYLNVRYCVAWIHSSFKFTIFGEMNEKLKQIRRETMEHYHFHLMRVEKGKTEMKMLAY